MRTLDRKVLRDLRPLWSQALTIALVVASGIGGFVATLSTVDSLQQARDDFYMCGRFATSSRRCGVPPRRKRPGWPRYPASPTSSRPSRRSRGSRCRAAPTR